MTSADHVCLLCMKETAVPHQYPCPFCGGDDRTLTIQSPALPPRTVLDHRYVLGRTLGQGGFGITYQAYDLRMGNTVAVKEYFPTSLVGRDSNVSSSVTVNAIKGARALEEYASGLRHFLFEARRQAKLASSPGVVSVSDFFEANHTAYYIMEFVDGDTLVRHLSRPLPISETLNLLQPIADSLMSIHEAGLIHRDISPDNIMCARNGQRKLLDFGASHSFTEEESTTGNATLKHGFAPPEQYGTSSMQGPWTDVYAFAATVYWCLTGKIPQDSMDRSIGGDRLRPPSELGAVIAPDAEAVLMRGMALPVTARYQDMETFWSKLTRAVYNSAQQRPLRHPAPEFSDPEGKTTVVPKFSTLEKPEMEVPEVTRVPEAAMERSEPSQHRIPTSLSGGRFAPASRITEEPQKLPSEPAVLPDEPLDEPDITLYQPSLHHSSKAAADAPLPKMQEVPPSAPPEAPQVSSVSVKSNNRLLMVVVTIIALFGGVYGWALTHPTVQPLPDSSLVDQTVVIGGTEYPIDATEIHLIGSGSYVPLNRKGVEYTTLDYLSASDWRSICQMTNLHRLSLVGLGLDTLSGIEELPLLEILDVSGNQLTNLDPLSHCVNLNELYAADNRLTDCPILPNLVYLDLSGNEIGDVSGIASLSRLTTLYLHRNAISEVSPLSSIRGLTTLDIAHNRLRDLSGLERLSGLRLLYVDGNTLTNDQLSAFHKLLPDCALDVDILTDIPDKVTIGSKTYSTSLTKLSLASKGLQNEDIQNLKYMVHLTELELSGNNISDVSCLSRLYSLTTLNLSYNKIQDINCLSGLYQLNTLYLSSNKIADLSVLSQLTQLETLAIGNNLYTDISALSALTDMRTLVMCNCAKQELSWLYTMQDLFELRISKGVYSDQELDALREAVPSVHINQY